jgi:hypothetical protein
VYLLQALAAAKLKPASILLAARAENALEQCYPDSWIGFERSTGMILPNTDVAAIYQEATEQGAELNLSDWMQKIRVELHAPTLESVLYREEKRHVCQIQPTSLQPGSGLLKSGATYLITGGCGGLGLLFANYLATTYTANLILTGRSPLDENKQAKIKELEASGSQVLYVQADVCDVPGMQEGVNQAKKRFGGIQGVIHAAGIEARKAFLTKISKVFSRCWLLKLPEPLYSMRSFKKKSLILSAIFPLHQPFWGISVPVITPSATAFRWPTHAIGISSKARAGRL